jgi:hypothetical protein
MEMLFMNMAKTLSLVLVCVLFLSLIVISEPVSADAVGPEITDVILVPSLPQYPEEVTIYATVTDLDGVQNVDIVFCDDFLCYMPVAMTQIGTSDVWEGTIPLQTGWGNGTHVGYEISAYDNLNNNNLTYKKYYFYVSAINMTTEIDKDSIREGESITLSGSAIFNGNESAYVENSQVTVTITDSDLNERIEYTTTDENGNFTIDLPFDLHGEYQINVTLTNRTMSAYYETSVMVVGINYLSEKLQMTTLYPDQVFWVNGTAKYSTDDPVINSDIVLKINETLIWTGKTDASGNYAIQITAPSELGNYDLNASVTNGTLVHYNETSFSVTAVPLPDIFISNDDINVTSDYTPHIAGSEIEIKVKIHNLGLADCPEVTISIYNGPITEDDLIVQNDDISVACGSFATYTLQWTTMNGTYDLYIYVDPQDAVKESFEDNNNASVSIYVDGDYDQDQIGDSADPDDDNDGHNDDVDAFPLNSNEWLDTDGDGKGNNLDLDDDNDGLADTKEALLGTNPLKADTDGDGYDDDLDYDPLDPEVWDEPDEPRSEFPWLLLIIIIIVVVLMIIFLVMTRKKEEPLPPPPPQP